MSKSEDAEDLANEVMQKSFSILLAHFGKRLKQNPEYEFPAFLEAMLIAGTHMKDPNIKAGERFSGMANSNDGRDSFLVTFEKAKEGFIVVSFVDLNLNKEVSITNVLKLIELAIRLDNVDSDEITLSLAVKYLNDLSSDTKFVKFPNNQWREYSKQALKMLKEGGVDGPPLNSKLIRDLEDAKSFSDIPQVIRGFMSSLYARKKFPDQKIFGMSSPNNKVPKYKIWSSAKEILYGTVSEDVRKKCGKVSD